MQAGDSVARIASKVYSDPRLYIELLKGGYVGRVRPGQVLNLPSESALRAASKRVLQAPRTPSKIKARQPAPTPAEQVTQAVQAVAEPTAMVGPVTRKTSREVRRLAALKVPTVAPTAHEDWRLRQVQPGYTAHEARRLAAKREAPPVTQPVTGIPGVTAPMAPGIDQLRYTGFDPAAPIPGVTAPYGGQTVDWAKIQQQVQPYGFGYGPTWGQPGGFLGGPEPPVDAAGAGIVSRHRGRRPLVPSDVPPQVVGAITAFSNVRRRISAGQSPADAASNIGANLPVVPGGFVDQYFGGDADMMRSYGYWYDARADQWIYGTQAGPSFGGPSATYSAPQVRYTRYAGGGGARGGYVQPRQLINWRIRIG